MSLIEQSLQFWYWLVLGLIFTLMLGPLTELFLNYVNKQHEIPRPAGIPLRTWRRITNIPGKKSARLIAALERGFFFVAFWVGAPELVAGWLVLRVAAKWDAWANIQKIPAQLEGADQHEWLAARLAWGSRTMQRFVGGQLLNVIEAIVGVAVARLLVEVSTRCINLATSSDVPGLLRNLEIACA